MKQTRIVHTIFCLSYDQNGILLSWKRVYQRIRLLIIIDIMPVCTAVFDTFQPISCDVLSSIIHKLNRTTCGLDFQQNDWCLAYLLLSILCYVLWIFVCLVFFPASCKYAIISLLIKGPLKLCLYLLPLSAILMYLKIGYHVDNISFKQPLETIFEIIVLLIIGEGWLLIN